MIISNFPTERNWNNDIEALAVEILSGEVHLPIETRDGTALTIRTGVELDAYRAYSYSEISGKPKINGFVLGPDSTDEQLGLASIDRINALLTRIVALEEIVSELTKTDEATEDSQSE